MADKVITIIIPNIKAVDEADEMWSVSVKDVNSDDILTAAGG